jgi:hypothetical protein
LVVNAGLAGRTPTRETIAELLDWAHERIVERFEVTFSDKAKLSFQPETSVEGEG